MSDWHTDERTTGAWIVHHSRKLSRVVGVETEYERLEIAGKCGTLLSAMCADNEAQFTDNQVRSLARASGIRERTELPFMLNLLEGRRLIDRDTNNVAVLGLTSGTALEHIAKIFESLEPDAREKGALGIAEKVSEHPQTKDDIKEWFGDTYQMKAAGVREAFKQYESIGFVDSETRGNAVIFFNGNLFRKDEAAKIHAALATLRPEDQKNVGEVMELLRSRGCMPAAEIKKILGKPVYERLVSIGFLDVNIVGNESGTYHYVTRPAAFSKYQSADLDDAFDFAKAFVASLTYGMTRSDSGRGRIFIIDALMRKLISGTEVGPATAIGQDYRVLEMRGVIQLRHAGGNMYYMKLRKREVGEIALQVIQSGEVGGDSLLSMPPVGLSRYEGPERYRGVMRRKDTEGLNSAVAEILFDLRTGGRG